MEREPIHPLEIRLLGAIEITAKRAVAVSGLATDSPAAVGSGDAATESVSIGGRIQRRILAALLAARPDVVSIDRLVDITWTAEPPARAEHNIRTYISRLRTVLGTAATLEQVGDGYRIALVDAGCDLDRFDELVNAAERLRTAGSTSDALEAVRRAETLWQGQPFGEFAFEPWALAEVARLEDRHHQARMIHAELLLSGGRAADAVTRLQAIVTEHPLREQPRALLMRSLYAAGRTTEALREFHDFRTHLRDDVGLDPSPELVELDQAIARGELTDQSVTVKIGGYELHERIGAGAFAVVHRATQTALGREVAIKIIRAELATQPSFVRAFEREARVVARLEHDAIVPLHDFWRDPDQAYLIMRYLPGGSLADRLETGPLPVDEVAALVERIGAALAAAHEAGVIHRDVKPANILFDGDGRAVLGDFGIAIQDNTPGHGAASQDSDSSARFAAPEQLRGDQPGPSADVYSLALVVWSVLSGRAPFASSSSDAVVEQKVSGGAALEPISSLRPDLPEALAAVIDEATNPDPTRRPTSIKQLVDRLRNAFAGPAPDWSTLSPATARRASVREPGVNPYQGLRSFDEATARHYHGRKALVDELTDQLAQPNQGLLTVVGASGSGKSSVVRAGLLPALRSGAVSGSEDWFVTSMTPGAHPFESLETAALRVAVNPPGELLSQLTSGERGLIRSVERLLPERDGCLLLIIDQFEELFTNTDPATANRFLDALATALTEPNGRLRVVATLRGDFYDRPLRHQRFASLLKNGTVAVTPLSPEELEAVIVEPARSVGVDFEPGLVARIMSDTADQPGSLALLEYALTLAFDRSDGRTITAADYSAIGGLEGALVGRAEQLHDDFDPDERGALRRVMESLVALGEGTEDTRRRALRSELGTTPEVSEVIDAFSAARLFTLDNDPATREPTVEVAHETLIRSWPRLREWLDDDRDDLRLARHLSSAARDWDAAGRPNSELYRGGRLEAASDWRTRSNSELAPGPEAFLEASVARAAAERRAEAERLAFEQQSNQRLRRLLAGVAVLLALALVAGGVAFQQRRTARDTAYDAETSRLVATAQALADSNPRAALLLAVAAHQREQTPETLGALQVALAGAAPVLGVLAQERSYVDVEWLSNGLIVGIRLDGVDLFDPATAEHLDSVDLAIGPGFFPEFRSRERGSAAPDVPMLSILTDDLENEVSAVVVFDATNRRLQQVANIAFDVLVATSAIRAGGEHVAAVGFDNVLRVFDLDGSQRWEERLDQSKSLFEQGLPVISEDDRLRGFLEVLPVASNIFPDDRELVVSAGTLLYRFSWDGAELSEPWFLTGRRGPGYSTVEIARTVLLDDDGPRSIVSDSKIWTEATAAEPLLDGATIEASSFDALEGGGLPRIVDGRSTVIGDVYLVSDGSLVLLDPERLSLEYVAEIPTEAVRALAVHPLELDTVAVASPAGGITIIDLLGAGPIAEGFPRPSTSGNLTISADGRTALAASAGASGPSELWRRGPDGWDKADWRAGLLGVYGGIPPKEGDFIWIRDSQDGAWIFAFDQETITELLRDSRQPGSIAGATSLDLGLAAFSGGFNVGAAVRVQTFPDLETVIDELPIPQGDGGPASAIGVEFDPAGTRLLVGMPDGQFDVWNVATWERLDIGEWSDESISLASWNADGSLVATAAPDGAVTIRNGEDFEPVVTMVGSVGTTNSWNDGTLLFSEDDSLLLTNIDGVGRLWDVESGQQIGQPFEAARSTNSGVNIGANGLQLITGSERGALVWNLDTDSWPEIACRAAGSNLTEDEWAQWGPRDEPFRLVCP